MNSDARKSATAKGRSKNQKGPEPRSVNIDATVKFFKNRFGFLVPDNGGEDVFIHISALEKSGVRSLSEKMRVRILATEPDRNGKRDKAVRIELRAGA